MHLARFRIISLILWVSGWTSFSLLLQHLVKELRENNPFLPTILQSLSSIAEISVPIFETQEDDIVRFVVRSLLQKDSVSEIYDLVFFENLK
jgi:sister-chromatid-cohesion protein PDS5